MFELNAGIRLERAEGDLPQRPARRLSAGHDAADRARTCCRSVSDETLFSYRFGAVFKPTPTTSLYVAYGNARTPTSATVRLGCGALAAAGARRSLRRRAGDRAQLRDRRQGRSVRPPAAADRGPVPQRAQQFPRRLERSRRARRRRCSTAARGSTARARRSAATSRRTGRSSPITPISTARCCRASPISASPIPTRRPASTAPRIPDPQAGDRLIQTPQPFGQPVHHLPAAVRAPDRLRPHLSGQLRDPSAQPAAAHPIFHRRLPDPPRCSCPTRSGRG